MRALQSILLLTLLLMEVGCTLEEDARSFITPDEFFREDRDAQAAVNAIYETTHSGEGVYARYFWLLSALFSDLALYDGYDPDLAGLSSFQITPQNRVVEELWRGLFQAVNTANWAIQELPLAPISRAEVEALVAEARFLRAFFYFDLVRLFGQVPVIESPVLDVSQLTLPPRSEIDSVYRFIEQDFLFAASSLPDQSAPGRPSRYSAMAYLAKVYIYQGAYNQAAQMSRAVILSNEFTLVADYQTLFRESGQNGSETIFSANLGPVSGAPINRYLLPSEVLGYGNVRPTSEHLAVFDPQDRRYQVTYQNVIDLPGGGTSEVSTFVKKYRDPDFPDFPTIVDLPFMRYAELLLLHAEALNELRNGTSAEALTAINTVRTRARFDGSSTNPVLPPLRQMNKEDFKAAILQERFRELSWEGHRWFDLVHFGQLGDLVPLAKPEAQIGAQHTLLPVPARELELNPALGPQNPGY